LSPQCSRIADPIRKRHDAHNKHYTEHCSSAVSPPPGVDQVVKYNGHYYALRPEIGYQWNREAFRLLYQLFQMTMVKLPQVGVPGITISK